MTTIKNLIDVTKIKPTLAVLNNGKDVFYMAEPPKSYNQYKDGKRTEQIGGTVYTVLFPLFGYSPFTIKVEGELTPSIPPEKFQNSDALLPVKVEGFSGRIYGTSEGHYALSATATAIKLV